MSAIATIGSVLYPFALFVAIPHIPATYAVAGALMLAGLRIVSIADREKRRLGIVALACAALILSTLSTIDPALAAKSYPVLVSLAAAALFGGSLIWPPTLIERIARRREPNLDAAAISYTRMVTWAWTILLLFNAAVALALAVWASLGLWTLWTGLISYLLMAGLLVGEWIVRRQFLSTIKAEGRT